MIYFFAFTTILFLVSTFFLLKNVLKLSDAIIELEEQVEESLDIIDARYSRISEISQLPIAFDDPIVKDLVNEINVTRESLLLIANKIASFSGDKDE